MPFVTFFLDRKCMLDFVPIYAFTNIDKKTKYHDTYN